MRTFTGKPKATRQSGTEEVSSLGHAQALGGHDGISIFQLHRTIGNQAVQRLFESHAEEPPTVIQTKLSVSSPGDPCEQEADRVADQVMRMASPGAAAPPPVTGAVQGVQRNCTCGGTCRNCSAEKPEEGQGKLLRSPEVPQRAGGGSSPPSSSMAVPPIVHEVLRSPGQPLDSATRAFMEPRFGYDFSSVRLHTGGAARSSTADLGALAYTVGSHIVARDESPSHALLAHELAHVVQQSSAPAHLVQRQTGGGQGDQKSFNPSRGPLTGAEKAKLLALRRSLNFPDTPTPSDTSIVGILVTEKGEEIPFHSGERGGYHGGVRPADVKGGPGSGTNRINRTHVETWAANAMRKLGLKKAVLLIEQEPCAVCGGYGKGKPTVDTKVPGVSAQLPEDAQLIVVDGQSASYFRQTPTDPQTPTRMPAKPPIDPSRAKPGKAPDDPTAHGQPGGKSTGKAPVLKGQGGGKPHTGGDVEPGGKSTGKSPVVKGQAGGKPHTGGEVEPGGKPTGKSPEVKGQGGVTAHTGGEVEPGGKPTGKSPVVKGQAGVTAHPGGEVEPGGKSTGKSPVAESQGGAKAPVGTAGGLAIDVGLGIATLGLDWLASYLKQRVDQKIAARQIAAFIEVAKKNINANPDEAVKKMMVDPYRPIYAWVYLDSSVITSIGVDALGQPTMSDSSPIIDLSGRIDYEPMPLDPSLINSFPRLSPGAHHVTVTRSIVIDLALLTPPLEDLISYAKMRKLPMDDLFLFANGRYQDALTDLISVLEARQKTVEAFEATNKIFQTYESEFERAKRHKDVDLQKHFADRMSSTSQSLTSIAGNLKSLEEIIKSSNEKAAYWKNILGLIREAKPLP